MSRAVGFPFRRPSSTLIVAEPWNIHDDEGSQSPLQRGIEEWDYDRDLVFSRVFQVDVPKIKKQINIGDRPGEIFSLVVRVATGHGALRWVAESQVLADDTKVKTEIYIALKGMNLSQNVDLTSELITSAAVTSFDPGVPSRAGSRLWSDRFRTNLEGSRTRFPMSTLDFPADLAHLRIPDASWFLHWAPSSLSAPVNSNVRLYLNSANDVVTNGIKNKDPQFLATMRVDIVRQMCFGVLTDDSLTQEELEEADDESVGRSILTWLDQAFPGKDLSSLREILKENPSLFEARIQSRFGGINA